MNKFLFKLRKVDNGIHVNETIILDNKKFNGATFKNCHLVFCGSNCMMLQNCEINDCTYEFRGAAGATLQFMKNAVPLSEIKATFGIGNNKAVTH